MNIGLRKLGIALMRSVNFAQLQVSFNNILFVNLPRLFTFKKYIIILIPRNYCY